MEKEGAKAARGEEVLGKRDVRRRRRGEMCVCVCVCVCGRKRRRQ